MLPITPKVFTGVSELDITKISSNFYYNRLITLKIKALSLETWKTEIQINQLPSIKNVMNKKITDIKENKLKEFNYKFITRVGACGRLISKWNNAITRNCLICNQLETQYHIVFMCPIVKRIWQTLSNRIHHEIRSTDIVFGTEQNSVINNLITQVCYSIHKYWIVRTNEKKIASEMELLKKVAYDLKFKSEVMCLLGHHEIATIFNNAADWIHFS